VLSTPGNSRSQLLSNYPHARPSPPGQIVFLSLALFASIVILSGCAGVTSAKGNSASVTANSTNSTSAAPNSVPSAALSASPTALSFGNISVGSTSNQSLTLTNSGTSLVTISQTSVSGAGFAIGGVALPLNLNPGSSATFIASFAPTSVGNASGAASFNNLHMSSTFVVEMTGIGAPLAPSIAVEPVSKSILVDQTATFSVTASGTAPLGYQWYKNGTAIAGATSASYTTPAETVSDNGAQFTVVVSDSLGSITSSAAILTVNAATPGALTPSAASLSFGNVIVNNSSSRGVTLTNSGLVNITVSSVTVGGSGFNASGISSGEIIAPGQVVTLNVSFAPSATGSITDNLSIASDASNSPTTIGISGVGVLPHTATLSWTASTSTVIGYDVYRGSVSGGPYTLVNSSIVAGTQYVDSSVLAGQTYYYVATAVDSGNRESTYSDQVVANVPTP
jgi:Abnormal spindle-like microcephaly-assoc'd, ASPM-SPD-2-Hydin